MVNMAVLVLKMSIFSIFSYEQGECNATFRAHQVLKNGFHLITTSFYDQKSVLSPKEEISRNNFYSPLEQCALVDFFGMHTYLLLLGTPKIFHSFGDGREDISF